MKVIALFQFYFPYVLPRDKDWQDQSIGFQFPDWLVIVRPRNLGEELFPEDVDKTLSMMQLTLSRLSLPISSISRTVKDLCLDRIEVRVEGKLDLEEVKQPEAQENYRQIAIRACNEFLNHCRVVARASFIIGIEEHYRLQDQKFYVITPHSISWFEGESGNPLPLYNGYNATARSSAIPSPERGVVSMSMIQQSISLDPEPDLINNLLLDAQERIITLRIREAVISISTASEVAAHKYLRRKGKESDSQVKKILKKPVSFAEKRFHLITDLVDGRSLKNESPSVFHLLEKAYRTRNNVAHEGRAYFKDKGLTIEVDAPWSNRFLDAVESAINWLASL